MGFLHISANKSITIKNKKKSFFKKIDQNEENYNFFFGFIFIDL